MRDDPERRTTRAAHPNTTRGSDRARDPGCTRSSPSARSRARALGASGALAATALALLVLAGSVSASAAPGAGVTVVAPYSGTAVHSESHSALGCASASAPNAPRFVLKTGVATMTEQGTATTCAKDNGTSLASADGTAGLSFVEPWNVSTGNGSNGSSSALVAHWTIDWTSSVTVSGNGTLRYALADTLVGLRITVVDLTANRTVGTASWYHDVQFNLTHGSQYRNVSRQVALALNAKLLSGHLYEITTEISGIVTTEVQGSGARTVTTTLNLATLGDRGVLESIDL